MQPNKKTDFDAFCDEDSGAVTVDWVFLTAIILALTLALFGIISGATTNAASSTGVVITGVE